MAAGEEEAVMDLSRRVFAVTVGPLYDAEGVRSFLDYADAAALRARAANHVVVVATAEDRATLVGMAELRDDSHLSLLFVDPACHGRGIARRLVERVVELARARLPELRELTVNSSPNSVGVYERLGFRSTDPERTVRGVRFVPMTLELPEK
jgi:GNAT superfamily N-acetyltransferase